MMTRGMFIVTITLLSLIYVRARLRPLNDMIRHFEPLKYSAHQLMSEHHRARRDLDKSQRKLPLNFQAFGRQFDLELFPDDSIFTPDAKFEDQNGEFEIDRSGLYSGRSRTAQPTYVTGHVYHDVFTGVIVTELETYVIEPAALHFNATQHFHSIIYKESDVNPVRGRVCGVDDGKITESDVNGMPTITNLFRGRGVRTRRTVNMNKRTCTVLVDLEDKFVESVASPGQTDEQKRAVAMGQVAIHLNLVSGIFANTMFSIYSDPGVFIIVPRVIINLNTEPSFSNTLLGSGAFLEIFSSIDHSAYCLAYKFTHREFDNGVLGLAYVGNVRAGAGGICDPFSGTRTLNTGIVTSLNFGRTVPILTTSLTFAHEAGHNFGSPHDTGSCINLPDGNYIMSPQANPGNQPNNQLFSTCSIESMDPVIEAKGSSPTGCFEARMGVAFCGNGIVEEGEECDCGFQGQCSDPCCIATNCTRQPNVQCSPSEGVCCSDACGFRNSNFTCLGASECALEANCTGMNATCPTPTPIVNGTLCNMDMSVCFNGECSSSYCLFNGLQDCDLISDNVTLLCELSCTTNSSDPNACVSTFELARMNNTFQGRAQVTGGLCNGTEGYCDHFGVCRSPDDEGPLTRLTNLLFNPETLQNIQQYITTYWWAVLLSAIAIIVALVIMTWVCSVVPLPSLKTLKGKKNRENLAAPPPKRRKKQQPL